MRKTILFFVILLFLVIVTDFIHYYSLYSRYRLTFYRTYCIKEILDDETFIACPQGCPHIEGRFRDVAMVQEFLKTKYYCFSVDSAKLVTDYQTLEEKTNDTK